MKEIKIQTTGTCANAVENYDDLNSSDKETLPTSVHRLNSGEHADDQLLDDCGGGGCSHDSIHLTSSEDVGANMLVNHSNGNEVEQPQLVGSSSSPTKASPPIPVMPPPTTTAKGFGLKKWRRIRREITKDASVDLDATKMLKRGPANILDVKQPSDGSISSTSAFANSPGGADRFVLPGSSSGYRLAVDTTFNAGADSDNSEDRSSKSSTAASAPKYRHDALRASRHLREKHRANNVSGRNLSGIGQQFQMGKGNHQSDATSKKPRGEIINLEKDNSLSSMESDSRSCNSVFMRGSSSVSSDQVQSGRAINYVAYDEPASEEQCAEELRIGPSENVTSSQGNSAEFYWYSNEGTSKNHQLPKDCDPMVNSIIMLQSAQDALEREVQKFGEISKRIGSLCDDSGETIGVPVYSMSAGSEGCTDRASNGLGPDYNHAYLNKKVQALERRLKEAEGRLNEKELKIFELEATRKSMESAQEDLSAMELKQKRCQEMEAELEGLFKCKVEAEVEHVAITRFTEDLKVVIEDQIKLQEYLAKEQARLLRTTGDVEDKAVKLQGQAEELETILYRDMAEGEDILKMQRRVFKFTSCLFIQLILLVLVFGLCVFKLLPKSAVEVPT